MENEALLFKKMQLGDWTAFNLFFKEYMEQLYLYAVAFVKDRAAAKILCRIRLFISGQTGGK